MFLKSAMYRDPALDPRRYDPVTQDGRLGANADAYAAAPTIALLNDIQINMT